MRKTLISSDDPILTTAAQPVQDVAAVRHLAEDLRETMVAEGGVGIAAPQVGESLRIFVAGAADEQIVCVNPQITWRSDEEIPWEEGCLSLPRQLGEVIRPKQVEVEYTDLNGNLQKLRTDGLLGRVIQHEYDHLDGILFPSRMEDPSKIRLLTEAEWQSRFESADRAPE
jgi:peptide deformylase